MVISLSLPERQVSFMTFLNQHWWPWVRWGLSHQKRELKHSWSSSAPALQSELSCKACFAGSFREGSVHHNLLVEDPQHAILARSFSGHLMFSKVTHSHNQTSLKSTLLQKASIKVRGTCVVKMAGHLLAHRHSIEWSTCWLSDPPSSGPPLFQTLD